MLDGVKILAHADSSFPLDLHLYCGQWSEEYGGSDHVTKGPVFEGWEESCSASCSEIVLLNVE